MNGEEKVVILMIRESPCLTENLQFPREERVELDYRTLSLRTVSVR